MADFSRYDPAMTNPFFGDLDAEKAQSFGNLIWTTVALEGLVNKVCCTLLGAKWREGKAVGKNITKAQAVGRTDIAALRAYEWLDEARPKLYLRNEVLHSTVAAHMEPENFSKVSFYTLHNIRWDNKDKKEVETHTLFTVENMAIIQAEIETVIDGFSRVNSMLA